MRDFLSYVESNYGCVAEYNRCMEEREIDMMYQPGYGEDYDPEDYEDYEEETEPKTFVIGNEYQVYGIYGGITYYKVEKFNKDRTKVLMSEIWFDVDGTGTRPAEWHDLSIDENGNERALEWESEEYGKMYICA